MTFRACASAAGRALTIATLTLGLAACSDVAPPSSPPEPPLVPTYERQEFLYGLNAVVTVRKSHDRTGLTATFTNGLTLDYSEALALDRQAWLRTHGALGVLLVEHLDTDSVGAPIPVLLATRTIRDLADVLHDLGNTNPHSLMYASRHRPLAVVTLSPFELRRVAFDARIAKIVDAFPTGLDESQSGGVIFLDQVAELGLSQPHANGVTGAGVRVGVIEEGYCNPRIFNDFGTVQLLDPGYLGHTCTDDNDCFCGSANGQDDICVSGYCVDAHATGVTSLVSSIAPGAEVFFANTPVPTDNPAIADSVGCNPRGILEAYDGFMDKGVDLVVESFSCPSGHPNGPDTAQGVIEDFFADRVLTLRSAGNSDQSVACSEIINGLCVGASNVSDGRSCYSAFINPSYLTEEWDYFGDREEPDILALSGDGGPGSSTSCPGIPVSGLTASGPFVAFQAFSGTSAAAPVAAGLLALWLGECQGVGSFSGGTWARNWAMAAAMTNADGWRYSTSILGLDHLDGAGVFDRIADETLCNGEPPPAGEPPTGGGGNVYTLNPKESGEPVDSPGGPFPVTPVEPSPEPPGSETLDQGLLPSASTTGYRYLELLSFDVLSDEGGRLRSVISWNGCSALSEGPNQRKPSVDFDLFLMKKQPTANSYVYMSRSFDDVNEGMDVELDAGSYGVYVVWPDQETLCGEKEVPLYTTNWCFNCEVTGP